MNVEARQDIAWWLQFLLMCNGRSIISDPYWSRSPDLALFTDASGTVCYAVYSATTGLPNLGQLSYRTAPSSGKSFTLLLYFGVTYGLGRRFSSTVTTSLWLISGFPGHPVTLKTCTSFTPTLPVLTTQSLTLYPNWRKRSFVSLIQRQMQHEPPFLLQHRPSGMSSDLPPITSLLHILS